MQVIGITGNSGSGKSSVARIIQEQYNAELIDADKIAKSLLSKKTEYYNEIVKTFGEKILDENEISRRKLADIVYNNKEELKKLNNITNKHVVKEIEKEIGKSDRELTVIDVPLLFESNLDKNCDMVIAVISKKESKIDRICKRDNISRKIAIQRLSIQPNDSYYKEKTQYIIENNEDEEALKKEIKNALKLERIRTGM